MLPFDQELAQNFTPFAVHHCGMHCERFAELYCSIENLSWLEAGAFSDFAAVRRICGNRMLNLRYSPRNLLEKTPNEIEEEIRKAFADATYEGANTRTSMSCVGVDPDTPDENIYTFCRVISSL